jgi:hypothetical protein
MRWRLYEEHLTSAPSLIAFLRNVPTSRRHFNTFRIRLLSVQTKKAGTGGPFPAASNGCSRETAAMPENSVEVARGHTSASWVGTPNPRRFEKIGSHLSTEPT